MQSELLSVSQSDVGKKLSHFSQKHFWNLCSFMALVITACTNRKRIAPTEGMRASSLATGAMTSVSQAWVERLPNAMCVTLARQLYCGRSFKEASDAAQNLGARFAVISAGLGFVCGEMSVPSYGLTVIPGGIDNVLERVFPQVTAKEWWNSISALSPFSRSIEKKIEDTPGVVLVSLPESYLDMVSDDLADLPRATQSRLRIFTGVPSERVDERLRTWVMPYDDRLDGPDSPIPGTRSDFASRAVRHFVQEVVGEDPLGSAEGHGKRVRSLLSGWKVPTYTTRPRKTDAEILVLLRDHWEEAGGRSGHLLRWLRDELSVACEQGRLARLAARVRAEKGAK